MVVRPLVTVGIPFRNEGKMLELAIRSVLAQTYTDWELILVDDGADQQTSRVCDSFQCKHIKVIRDGQNLGLAARLNQITSLAKGTYIARMDADDIMHPERLGRQVSYLEANPEVQVLGTAAYIIDANNRVVGVRESQDLQDRTPARLLGVPFIHPSVMARRQWMMDNLYDEAYKRSQDFELWCRTSSVSRFANLQEPLMFYRESGVFSLQKYRMNLRASRQILLHFGPDAIGVFPTLMRVMRSYFRFAAYSLAEAVGLTERLLERRRKSISTGERLQAERILKEIATYHS